MPARMSAGRDFIVSFFDRQEKRHACGIAARSTHADSRAHYLEAGQHLAPDGHARARAHASIQADAWRMREANNSRLFLMIRHLLDLMKGDAFRCSAYHRASTKDEMLAAQGVYLFMLFNNKRVSMISMIPQVLHRRIDINSAKCFRFLPHARHTAGRHAVEVIACHDYMHGAWPAAHDAADNTWHRKV